MRSHFFFDPTHAEWTPQDYCIPLDADAIYGRKAPLHVDIGSGDGTFLVEMAALHPGVDFLGIERLLGRARKTCRKAARANLPNVRVLRLESHYAVRYLLPASSVQTFYVSFPDPWPKRRHNERRVFNTDFVSAVFAALKPNGTLRIKTDHEQYFRQMHRIATECQGFTEQEWPLDPAYPMTDFESGFRAKGEAVHCALFEKTSPVRNDSASNPST